MLRKPYSTPGTFAAQAVLQMQRNGQDYYYHADDQFNVVAVTDGAGAVVERYDYGDFGYPEFYAPDGTPRDATAIGNPWLFTGRPWDSELGAYYYRTRYFDPLAGRFLSPDSIGNWADPLNLGNAYTYTGNNPWSLVDPWGQMGWYPGIERDVEGVQQIASGVWNIFSPRTQNRITGTVGVVGGGVEMLGGATMIVGGAPTVIAPVAGVVVTVDGADTLQASFWQVWTGERVRTSTAQGITYVTGSETAGDIGDMAIGFVDLGASGVYWLSRGGRLVRAAEGAETFCEVRALERIGGEVASDFSRALENTALLGRVDPPANLIPGTTPFGNEMHARIAGMLQEMYPDVEFTFRVKPGQNGIDVEVPRFADQQATGFQRAEIKPRSFPGERRYNSQVENWGFQAGEVTPITYDADGNVYIGFGQ